MREAELAALSASSKKLVLVGQQPGVNDPGDPLSPDNPMWTGYRIMRLAGVTSEDYRKVFRRININYENQGKFRASEAQRNSARRIFNTLHDQDTMIMLGTAVARCFKGLVPSLAMNSIREVLRGRDVIWVALLPHPSGLNRMLNDPSVTAIMARILRELYVTYEPLTRSEP